MEQSRKVDALLAKTFASAAIRAIKEQCQATITVGMPGYRKEGFPMQVDVASFVQIESPNFSGSMALCYPRATFLGMVAAMTGEKHAIISSSVRDGAAEILNIVYGEVKQVLNSSEYKLPMAIPKVLLADAALEVLLESDPAVIVPFETQFGPFFAQIGLPAPKKAIEPPKPRVEPGKSLEPGLFARDIRVLVVDDMSTMRKIVRKVLGGLGYTDITEAVDGADGWTAITKACGAGKPYDLIISDWNMPNMKGIDLLKKVRANISVRHTPFVLLTAESEMSQIMTAVSAGANAYILKPFTAESVTAKLKEVYAKLPKDKRAA